MPMDGLTLSFVTREMEAALNTRSSVNYPA